MARPCSARQRQASNASLTYPPSRCLLWLSATRQASYRKTRSGSGEVERLLEDHGVDLRLAACNKRLALDLIEPLLVQKHRPVGITTVLPGEPELAAVGAADTVRNVELDHAAFRHRLDRMADQVVFIRSAIAHLGDRQLEHAGVLGDRVDARFERA